MFLCGCYALYCGGGRIAVSDMCLVLLHTTPITSGRGARWQPTRRAARLASRIPVTQRRALAAERNNVLDPASHITTAAVLRKCLAPRSGSAELEVGCVPSPSVYFLTPLHESMVHPVRKPASPWIARRPRCARRLMPTVHADAYNGGALRCIVDALYAQAVNSEVNFVKISFIDLSAASSIWPLATMSSRMPLYDAFMCAMSCSWKGPTSVIASLSRYPRVPA